ncbi:MAG TPA: rRNA maturation RNase YbeY [Pirellulales bacterium]|jgi:probable rRNA maturation factor|nr:rRNA maturation RNase YbeY [Pirellulales bacterium]
MLLSLEISNAQAALAVDEASLRAAVESVLAAAGYEQAEISLAVVQDRRIHEVNRQFLQHDYPTDVISFLWEQGSDRLEGEIVVSAETAVRCAAKWNWPAEHELLLYVVHGLLHLVGYDDTTPAAAAAMRAAEQAAFSRLGIGAVVPREPELHWESLQPQ